MPSTVSFPSCARSPMVAPVIEGEGVTPPADLPMENREEHLHETDYALSG